MTTEAKEEIRKRITAATGSDCGAVHPEFFLDVETEFHKPAAGNISVTVHEDVPLKAKYMLVNLHHRTTGKESRFGAFWCN